MAPRKKPDNNAVKSEVTKTRAGATTRSITKAATAKTKAKDLPTTLPEPTHVQTRSKKAQGGVKKPTAAALRTRVVTTTTRVNKTTTRTDKPDNIIRLNVKASKTARAKILTRDKYISFPEYVLLRAIDDAQETCKLNPDDELTKEYLNSELARYRELYPPMTPEEKKIKHLKDMKTRPGLREGHIKNIDAIIRDYQTKRIKYNKGKGYYYYKGELILGPFPSGEFMKKMHTSIKIKRLVKEEGDRINFRENAWFEAVGTILV